MVHRATMRFVLPLVLTFTYTTLPSIAQMPSGASSQPAAAPQAKSAPQHVDSALEQKARAIHDRIIALDTHNDINPVNFTTQKNYTQRLDTQVNLPKMIEGGLDASFFIVYVGQGELTPRRLRQGVQSRDREVRRDPPSHKRDCPRHD